MSTMTLPAAIQQQTTTKPCRFCGAELQQTFVDLGMSPLCETYPSAADLNRGETYYPLHAYVCSRCFLVQLEQFESGEAIFSDYAYFSSYSDSWLKHCEKYCDKMMTRFGLNEKSFVVEVASNDGYLLQYFVRSKIPVLGIEPAAQCRQSCARKGDSHARAVFRGTVGKRACPEGAHCRPRRR